jgi:hypothetical protein
MSLCLGQSRYWLKAIPAGSMRVYDCLQSDHNCLVGRAVREHARDGQVRLNKRITNPFGPLLDP